MKLQLQNILRCPKCGGKLNELKCERCGAIFDEVKGVPVFKSSIAYNSHYRVIDNKKRPFGYSIEYSEWRKGQINKNITKYVTGYNPVLLDNGGGYGDLRKYLPESVQYHNIDVSSEMIFQDDSDFRVVGAGESLPYADNVFDYVVSGDVLEHVEDKELYLRECNRVLKQGGVLLLNTPRTGWRSDFLKSIWFWIPLLSGAKSRIKYLFKPNKPMPAGIRDVPSDRYWLCKELNKAGFYVIDGYLNDNHLFSFTSKFWRWFADRFISAEKYGHCIFYRCVKI